MTRASTQVTAILLNWQRPANVHCIVTALRKQAEPVEMWVINNANMAFFDADRHMFIPWNAGVSIRVLMAVYVETPWIMFLDDDLMPGDTEFVKDALAVAEEHPRFITGAYGRHIAQMPPYYFGDADGRVEVVKGRFMLFRRELLERVRMPCVPPGLDVRFCEDIHLSLEAGDGSPMHWVDAGLRERLVELPDSGGLSHRPEHMAERERFCEWWLEQRFETQAWAEP